jgi:DNA invertase Pin-like site-specific DNA recombinase
VEYLILRAYMKIGYARVSKNDGKQSLDLQIDALKEAGVNSSAIYTDKASGKNEDRPGLEACLKTLRAGDQLFVWKLDRLGRSLKHLVEVVQNLSERDIGFTVLTGQGANIDTSTASGKLIFGIFASLAEFERELIRERTIAGLKAARARGRVGGRKHKITKAQIEFLRHAMQNRETNVKALSKELGLSTQTVYRYVTPEGELRDPKCSLFA